MEYDEAQHLAEIKASVLVFAHEVRAKNTIAAIERGEAVNDIIRTALDELDIDTLLTTLHRSEDEQWEHGHYVRFPKLKPHQASKLAAAILRLEPRDLRTTWVYRALTDTPGFNPKIA